MRTAVLVMLVALGVGAVAGEGMEAVYSHYSARKVRA